MTRLSSSNSFSLSTSPKFGVRITASNEPSQFALTLLADFIKHGIKTMPRTSDGAPVDPNDLMVRALDQLANDIYDNLG